MFYIYYKLENKKQISQLYPEKISLLEGRISALLSRAGGSPAGGQSDIFQFAALYRETVLNVLNCAESLKALLNEFRQFTAGYSIILSAGHEQDDLALHFHNLSLTVNGENRIWLEDQMWDKFSDYIEQAEREEYSHLIPVSLKSDMMLSIEERYSRFLKREDLVPRMKQEMNQWLYRQDESPGMIIRTDCGEEALSLLHAVLEDKTGIIEDFLLIEPAEGFWDPWYPLTRFINRSFLEQAEAYLSSDDRLSWDDDRDFLDKISQADWYIHYYDQAEIDFFKAFVTYWRACLKKLDSYTASSVLIISRPELFPESSLRLLQQLLKVLKKHFPAQKYIFISEMDALPEGLDASCRKLQIPKLDNQNIRLKAADIFPELKLNPEELLDAYDQENRCLTGMFYFLQNRLEGISVARDDLSSPGKYLYGRDVASLEILYLAQPGCFCLSREQVIDFFQFRGISQPEAEERLKRLEALGYLRFKANGGLWFRPLNTEALAETSGFDKDALLDDFSRFLNREMEADRISSLSGLFHFLNSKGSIDFGLDVLSRIIHHLLKIRQHDLAEGLLKQELFEGRNLSHAQHEGWHNIQFAGRLRSCLIRDSREEVNAKMEHGYLSLMEAQGACSEEFLLQQAHYHALCGDSATAQTTVKESLFAFQQNSDHYGEIRANTALALTMLSQRKLQPAVDYFEIALRISEQLHDQEASLICGKLMTLAGYLFGNLSMALRSLDTQMKVAETQRNRETQAFQVFLKGRILFELGRHQEAFKVFKQGRRLTKHYALTAQSRIMTAWMARSLCLGHSEKIADELLGRLPLTLEIAYFRAEAAHLSGDDALGIKYLEEAFAGYDPHPQYIHEMDSWQDGFRLIEGRLSDRDFYEDVLLDQAKGFYYYLIGLNGRAEEAWEGLRPLCRMDKAYNQQPFGYYFFLYAADIMQTTGVKFDETHESLISHAFKLLQTRAGRFDSQQMKHSFFRKNYWNNQIVLKAQDLNLI